VRLGVVLDGRSVDTGGESLRRTARAVEDAGLDLVWLRQDAGLPDPLVAATALTAVTTGLRIGVEIALGSVHPVVVAEAAAVCDLVLRGRLVLGLRAAPGDEADLAEAVELILRSHRAVPFSTTGPRWPTPARLPANEFSSDTTVRVLPLPAQIELTTWVVGAPDVAARFGLSLVAADAADGAAAWERIARTPVDAARPWSRPGMVDVVADGTAVDHAATIEELLTARSAYGLDTALLTLPQHWDQEARERAVGVLGRLVRPRVQQERLSEGLIAWWDDELAGPFDDARA
jgi:alkanesulfonate monooxygenase SsuD/methylene tetrahydromethanopterin reductase-like flavin-dependent oxidoreductase (luciferase family)